MTNYDVTVIVTTYNNEDTIRDCLYSILNQSENVKVLVIDDGSYDKTASIVKEIALKYQNVKYYYQSNSGVSAARNNGIKLADGKYLMFVDADDKLGPDIIKNLKDNIDEDTDIISCCCNVIHNSHTYTNYFYSHSFTAKTIVEKEKLILQLLDSTYGQPGKTYTAIGVPWGKLYRRQFILDNKLQFDLGLKRLQDNVFNLEAILLATEFKYINKGLYYYNLGHIKHVKMIPPEIRYRVAEKRERLLSNNLSVGSIATALVISETYSFVKSLEYYAYKNTYASFKKHALLLLRKPIYSKILVLRNRDISKYNSFVLMLIRRKLFLFVYLIAYFNCFKHMRLNFGSIA